RFFEKSGTVDPEASYYVPLENVVNPDNQDIKTMVDRGRYFSIFAPRQSGKTTYLTHFCKELHKGHTV
ncbi:MAG: AAA family ATPase, partial [Candidatus Aminicenantes bacterium]|nr:AAA family ATPase [Candidatus Aminicenantes bacterium]NIM80692.1 AAA family ATPase [Candidatus Aminicenantes bacterium]NIN20067.1 AAA family ATPase [Candidatus Aminicenantes bacterium]NIN43854.1 AAA family ATPase [Candidatus Aminicenantes bacterium]NIN86665.1 AAA family ATPase [Candidatus Aminicenantes bacterium]